MRLQIGVLACYTLALLSALTFIVVGRDTFSKVMMLIVALSTGFMLYVDARRYLDARKQP
jgi:energy-converting hydrogenase Eha subunit C